MRGKVNPGDLRVAWVIHADRSIFTNIVIYCKATVILVPIYSFIDFHPHRNLRNSLHLLSLHYCMVSIQRCKEPNRTILQSLPTGAIVAVPLSSLSSLLTARLFLMFCSAITNITAHPVLLYISIYLIPLF